MRSLGSSAQPALYLLIILVKVLAVFQEGLHIAQQLPSKVGLQGQQLVLDLGAP